MITTQILALLTKEHGLRKKGCSHDGWYSTQKEEWHGLVDVLSFMIEVMVKIPFRSSTGLGI